MKIATGCCVLFLLVLFFSSPVMALPVGDLNGDYLVDFDDLVLFAGQWMQNPDCFGAPGCPDLEGNDGVNSDDFALMSQNWLERGQITLVINEIMASNSTLEDPQEPKEYPDWIEICNYGDEAITLTGMYLGDDDNLWQIPAGVLIQAGGHILFWADDDVEQGNCHTNFKLDKGEDSVTLLAVDGKTIIDTVSFSDQETDVSYGRYPDASASWYLMASPSPGLVNTVGMAGEVYFSRLGGTFTSNFLLTLSAVSSTAQIRYTTDGSIPTESSNLYSSPITMSNSQSQRIRARAYDSPLAPGAVTSHSYIPLAANTQGFTSNLPIIVIDTHSTDINREQSMVSAVFIDTDKGTSLAHIEDIPDHAGRAGLKIRGESSDAWPKKHYALELWNENDDDAKVSLFGMPSESDWTLNNPYGDKTLIRNVLAYKWANDIGQGFAAPGTKMVEIFVNEDGGTCSYEDYRGVYVLVEKIKVSPNRLDIGTLNPSDIAEPQISGGYILRIDKDYSNIYEEFTTSFNMINNGDNPGIQYYDPDQYTLNSTQKGWILNHFNEYESVLNSSTFNDPVNGYAKYINVESFIEYDLITELFKEADGFRYSTYLYKEKNGKIAFGPQWDRDLSSGNATNDGWWYPEYYSRADTSEGWYNNPKPAYGWHRRLLADNDYKLKTVDKWFEHREDKLSDAQITADIDYYYTLLDSDGPLVNTGSTPADRNFAKWPILNQYEWCNYYYGNNWSQPDRPEQGHLPHTYKMETEWLKNWFNGQGTPAAGEWYLATHSDRLGNLDALWLSDRNICTPPTLSVNGMVLNQGGQVSTGNTLTMSTACSGTIYYTTDGTDPRTWTTSTGSLPPFNTVLAAEDAIKKVLVPATAVSNNWKGGNEPFNDSAWTNYSVVAGKAGSVGYERSSSYDGFISYDIETYLYGNNVTQSCLIRIPFSVDAGQLANMTYLTLRARFDDAFVAYINGTEVYRSTNVPDPLLWSSTATGYVDKAANLVNYDISAFLGKLHVGGNNILAIHGLNVSSTSSDFLISAQLEAGSAGTGGVTSGGAISSSAIQYTGPINLTRSEYIKARLKNGTNWGALNEACYSVGPVAANLRVTEIMYHSTDPNLEFIEVKNIGAASINLAWVKFTDGIEFTFPDLSLGAGQYAVVVRNRAAFEAFYGTSMTIAGQFAGALDNNGEEIVLRDAFGAEILDFNYDNEWYPVTDGAGFSLNIINPANPDRNSWDDKNAWQAGSVVNGSPGSANPANIVPNGTIVINEIRTHSDSAPNDWIELYNTTSTTVDVGGWFISDDLANLKKYRIATGQSIPPHGYKVFTQDVNFGVSSADPGRLVGFGFSELGEQVYLSSGTGGNLAGGYSVWEKFEAAELDVSFGRYIKSAAENYEADFVLMQSMTSGAANSGPLVGSVVINEIMYHPSVIQDQLGEYIELKNRTGSAIGLFDAANPSNTWKFTKGIDYTFPTGVSIPAGGIILVVRTDPKIFRAIHTGVPASVGVYGPFVNSELNNEGEKIELSRPSIPEPGGFIPYIRVEQVNYSDGTHPVGADPWPTSTDGNGYSLHRILTGSFSNDVSNWTAASPIPGL